MPLALFATTDKTGVVKFAQALAALGWGLTATRGTGELLLAHGLKVVPVTELANTSEMLGGRLKTLHPVIFGGLLYRRGNPEDEAEVSANSFPPIDLLAETFYAFEHAVARGVTLENALSLIDVGGPAMLRAAAKNFPAVIPLCDPADYDSVEVALRAAHGNPAGIDAEFRRRLAVKAFRRCIAYDTSIAGYLAGLGAAPG